MQISVKKYAIQINGVKSLHRNLYHQIARWSNTAETFYQQGRSGQALYYE